MAPNPDASETLRRWQEEELALRARAQAAGVIAPADLASRSGLELFAAMFAGGLPTPPIGMTMDFIAVEVTRGRAVFQGRPGRAHYNPLGTVHGGWFATLLDSAVGCAVHSTLPAGKAYTTVELKVNFVRALTDRVPLVRAEGQVIHAGRSLATADGRLYGADGTLYAHASTTCFIFDARPHQGAAGPAD